MEDAMSGAADAIEQPAHTVPISFWVIAAISLLWNAYGGLDYTMSQTRNMGFIAAVAGSPEKAQEMVAMMDAFPAWLTAFWAIGVWGSVLGSVLLLMRSRHAVTAFAASLVGAVVSFGYQIFGARMPGDMNTPAGWAMTVVIVGAVVFFLWYARRSKAKGILR